MFNDQVVGSPGELVNRFVGLIDQSFQDQPYWLYDNGALINGHLGVWVDPESLSSSEFASLVRRRFLELIEGEEVDEWFLVRSAVLALDHFWGRQADSSRHAEHRVGFVKFIQECLADSRSRERYRQQLASQGRNFESDDEFIEELQRILQRHPLAQPTTPERELRRWSATDRWGEERERWLSDEVMDQWLDRRVRRAEGDR